MSDTCKTCAYWVKIKIADPNPKLKDYMAGASCECPKLMENYGEHAPDTLVYSYFEGGYFWTGPDFGCIHWEPK